MKVTSATLSNDCVHLRPCRHTHTLAQWCEIHNENRAKWSRNKSVCGKILNDFSKLYKTHVFRALSTWSKKCSKRSPTSRLSIVEAYITCLRLPHSKIFRYLDAIRQWANIAKPERERERADSRACSSMFDHVSIKCSKMAKMELDLLSPASWAAFNFFFFILQKKCGTDAQSKMKL